MTAPKPRLDFLPWSEMNEARAMGVRMAEIVVQREKSGDVAGRANHLTRYLTLLNNRSSRDLEANCWKI